jgi:hypothetical protein
VSSGRDDVYGYYSTKSIAARRLRIRSERRISGPREAGVPFAAKPQMISFDWPTDAPSICPHAIVLDNVKKET